MSGRRSARRGCWKLLLLAPCALLQVGCPVSMPDAPPTDLTFPQRVVADNFVYRFLRTARVFAALAPLTSVLREQAPGPCVTTTESTHDTSRLIILTYVDACEGDGNALAGVGSVRYTYEPSTRVGTLTFVDFAINGEAVTGSGTLGYSVDAATVTLTGSFELTVGTLDTRGVVTIAYEADQLRIVSGFWDTGLGADIELLDTSEPVNNAICIALGNNPDVIPQAGQFAFRIDGERSRAELAFSPRSPARREAEITVDDDGPFAYSIPNLPGAPQAQAR